MGRRKPSRGDGQRKPKKKLPRNIVLIFCEGKTEENYLKAFRKSLDIAVGNARIEVIDAGGEGDANKIWEQARKKFRNLDKFEQDLAKIWLVYDCEPHDPKRYLIGKQVYQKIGGHGSPEPKDTRDKRREFASVSWPSFETWLLMHHEKDVLSGLDTPGKAKTAFEKLYWPLPEIRFKELAPRLERAKATSSRLWKQSKKDEPYPIAKATSVHLLIEHMETLQTPFY